MYIHTYVGFFFMRPIHKTPYMFVPIYSFDHSNKNTKITQQLKGYSNHKSHLSKYHKPFRFIDYIAAIMQEVRFLSSMPVQ